jgi:hypothetical protein
MSYFQITDQNCEYLYANFENIYLVHIVDFLKARSSTVMGNVYRFHVLAICIINNKTEIPL